MILYKVGHPKPGFPDGETRRLPTTFGAPECAAPPAAPAQGGLGGLFKTGATRLASLFRPGNLVATVLHGGLNTIVRYTDNAGDEKGLSTFAATPGPNASTSTATVPDGLVGLVTTLTVQVRTAPVGIPAAAEDFPFGQDDIGVTVSSGPNAGATVTVTDNEDGTYTAEYAPTATGVDVIDITLTTLDGDAQGPIGGSPYSSTVTQIIDVPADYSTISAAVAAAGPGDQVVVQAGSYNEIVTVPAATHTGVTLTGVGNPSLTGSFVILSDDVTVEGFTVTTSGHNQGLQTNSVQNVTIRNNTFLGNAGTGDYRGVWLNNCQNCTLDNNAANGHQFEGLTIVGDATGTVVSNNTASGNGGFGIYMWPGSFGASVEDNEVFGHPICDIKNDGGAHTASGNLVDCISGFAVIPGAEINAVIPSPTAGVGQGITFLGEDFENTKWTFSDTGSPFSLDGFTFLSPSTTTAQYVYAPGLPAGNYDVTVTNTVTGGVSDPVNITVGSTFGTPELVGIFSSPISTSPNTSVTGGSTVYIQGYGIYTTGTTACFTQGTPPASGPSCAGIAVSQGTAYSGASTGLRAEITVPALSSSPSVHVQIRSGNSDFSAPITLAAPVGLLDQQNLLDGSLGGQGIGRFSDFNGDPDPNGTSYDFQDAQTFTVGTTGDLAGIRVPVRDLKGAAAGVILELTLVSGGLPFDAASLATVMLPPAMFSGVSTSDPNTWPFFDLQWAGISVTAGDVLAFQVRTTSTIGYLYNPESSNLYAGGIGYRRNLALSSTWSTFGQDFGFQTFVIP